MKEGSLEALLRRMSRVAEKHFNEHGDVDPMWLTESANGEQVLFFAPIICRQCPGGTCREKPTGDESARNFHRT